MRSWRLPVLLVLACAAVRGVAAWRTAVLFNDGPTYLRVAAWFYEGDFARALGHAYPPLYPLLTACLAPVTGDFALAGQGVSIVAGSLAVLPLYGFLRRAFDASSAIVGCVLYAVHPYAAIQSSDVQTEGLYFAFFLAAVAASWRAVEESSLPLAIGAGALAGMAYLVRPEGLGVVGVCIAFAAAQYLRGRMSGGALVRVAAATALAAAFVSAPYLLHLRADTGEWRLSRKKSLSDLATPPSPVYRPRVDEPDRERFAPPPLRIPRPRQAGLLPARIDFEPRAAAAAYDVLRVSSGAMHVLVALLVGVGLWSVRGPPGSRGIFLLLLLGAYGALLFVVSLNVGYLDRRHVMAPLLPLLGHAGLGLCTLAGVAARGTPLRALGSNAVRVATALLLLGISGVLLAKTWAPHREERLANRRAAEWLASRDDLRGPVAAEKHRTAWYAGEAFVKLDRLIAPGEPGAGPAGEADARSARFLIVDDRQLAAWPGLERLARTELHRVQAGGRTAFVYRLDATEGADQSGD